LFGARPLDDLPSRVIRVSLISIEPEAGLLAHKIEGRWGKYPGGPRALKSAVQPVKYPGQSGTALIRIERGDNKGAIFEKGF